MDLAQLSFPHDMKLENFISLQESTVDPLDLTRFLPAPLFRELEYVSYSQISHRMFIGFLPTFRRQFRETEMRQQLQ